MSTTTGAAQTQSGGETPTVSRGTGRWRGVLLLWLGVLVVATLLTGSRPASLDQLQRGLGSGEVTQVHLVGGLEPGAVGQAHVDILWHDGLLPRHTTVQQVSRDADSQSQLSSDIPLVGADLAAELTGWTPAGVLEVTREHAFSGSYGAVSDWRVANWVALTGVAWAMVTFVLLVSGPEPRLATRWAWFWLLYGAGPLALGAYLLVGLPRAGAPLRPAGIRLRGGLAFLLAVVLLGPAM